MTTTTDPAAGWLPPSEYVRTIANATVYGCLFFTSTRGEAGRSGCGPLSTPALVAGAGR